MYVSLGSPLIQPRAPIWSQFPDLSTVLLPPVPESASFCVALAFSPLSISSQPSHPSTFAHSTISFEQPRRPFLHLVAHVRFETGPPFAPQKGIELQNSNCCGGAKQGIWKKGSDNKEAKEARSSIPQSTQIQSDDRVTPQSSRFQEPSPDFPTFTRDILS